MEEASFWDDMNRAGKETMGEIMDERQGLQYQLGMIQRTIGGRKIDEFYRENRRTHSFN